MQTTSTVAPLRAIAELAFWLATAWLSGLIVVNTVPYFSFEYDFDFLVEKGALARDPLWRASFFYHLAGSLVCLVTGPILLSRRALRASRALHRVLGWAYVIAVLCVAAPSGLYLSVFAKGGLPGQVGFVVAGVLWFASTWLGLRAIRQRRMAAHVTWMARSYAIAWSAISFRLIQVVLFAFGVGANTNYVVSLWLSLASSIVLGEWGARYLRGVSRASALHQPSTQSITTGVVT